MRRTSAKIFTDQRMIPLLAILCAMLWGSAYPAIKLGYDYFHIASADSSAKLLFAGYRFFLAGFILLAFQKVRGERILPQQKKDFSSFLLLGMVHTLLQYVFLYIGMANTTGVKSSILGATSVFISILIAHFLYRNDRLSTAKILGCLLGFLAILVVNLDGQEILQFDWNMSGDGLVLLSTLMGCIGTIYNKELSGRNTVFIITGWQLIFGSLMLLLLGYSFGGVLIFQGVRCIVLLLYMALLSSVALLVWAELYQHNKVGKITVYSFLTPVFGTLLSALFLQESLADPKIFLALGLACAGIWIVNQGHESNLFLVRKGER